MKTSAPPSQNAPPSGTLFVACLLHPVEGAVFDDGAASAHRRPRCRGTPRCRRISPGMSRFEFGEVHEHHVWEIANLPPGADVVPERPERIAVSFQPVMPILTDVGVAVRSAGRPPGVSLRAAYHSRWRWRGGCTCSRPRRDRRGRCRCISPCDEYTSASTRQVRLSGSADAFAPRPRQFHSLGGTRSRATATCPRPRVPDPGRATSAR